MGVAGIMYGWLGGKERRSQREHEEHVVLSMNDFNEPEISQTRPSKILPQASPAPVAACLRPEHTIPGVKKNRIVSDFRPLGV